MKLTLLIDFNWLAISRLSVIKGFEKESSDNIKQIASDEFKDLIAKSIGITLNKFPCIDNIVIVSDMGSWRKQLEVPESLGEIKYKGNREKDFGGIDWNFAHKVFNETIEDLDKFGITTCKHINCEGDDWVWFWSKYLNAIGTDCIIWSADADLTQLVQTNQFGIFTCCYNGKGLIFNEEKNDDVEYFFNSIPSSQKMELCSRCNNVSYIDPDRVILSKILMGDSSDNIKPVAQYIKNERKYGFSKKDYEKLIKDLDINNIQYLNNKIDEIAGYIQNMKKFSKYNISRESIKERILYNEKLVWLCNDKIPQEIKEALNSHELKTLGDKIMEIKNNYKVLLKENDEIKNLFESI